MNESARKLNRECRELRDRLVDSIELNAALEMLLVCYRVGKSPSDTLLDTVSHLKKKVSDR